MKVRVTRAGVHNWYNVGQEYDVQETPRQVKGHDVHLLIDQSSVDGKDVGIGVGDFEVLDEQPKFPFKVRCIDDLYAVRELSVGEVYNVLVEHFDGDYVLEGVQSTWSKSRFEIVEEEAVQHPPLEEQNVVQAKTIDSHYNFDYTLTETDREKGVVKIDPYFVAKQWRLGSKDDTGVLFHCLKNISRYSDKNSKEREIKALHLQIKRLAELEGVSLNEMLLELAKRD